MYLVVPMTTKGKGKSPFYHFLTSVHFHDGKGIPVISSLMLSHLRTIDKKRFYKHKGTASKNEFGTIQKILQKQCFGESEVFSST
jgi:mRNA-degrading endonuclease toxin of MazEF toxin-antitoxin module